MSDVEAPQIYLITPPATDLTSFTELLKRVLETHKVACVRISPSSNNEIEIIAFADTVRAICHDHDIAVVIQDHANLVARLGLDGVHLSDGAKAVRKLRKDLGPDAIIGAFCGSSRHIGLSAGEAGADYVSFGPVGDTLLGHDTPAESELFAWWSEMIEIPVIAEGALSPVTVKGLATSVDFFAFGPEIWDSDDPVKELAGYDALLASAASNA